VGRDRQKQVRTALLRDDIEEFGRLLVAERPSVRFMTSSSGPVLRSLPGRDGWIEIYDAELDPGIDDPVPQWSGRGIGIRFDTGRVAENELFTGDLGTVRDIDDPLQVAFANAVFDAMRRVTKPHLDYWDHRPAPIRVGQAAERRWLEDESFEIRDSLRARINYRVRTPKPDPSDEPDTDEPDTDEPDTAGANTAEPEVRPG
jgi:hypothetical protein